MVTGRACGKSRDWLLPCTTGSYAVRQPTSRRTSHLFITTFARRFFVQVMVCSAFEVVCAAFEVVTMAGFRSGISTRAKTKLDVGTLQMQLD